MVANTGLFKVPLINILPIVLSKEAKGLGLNDDKGLRLSLDRDFRLS